MPTRFAPLLAALIGFAASPILAVASAAGEHVKSGSYAGTVGPGYPLSFRVSANGTEVSDLVLGFDESCNGAPAETAPLFHFKTLKIEGGKFSGSSIDHFGTTVSDSLHISGRFSGSEVTGKVTDTSAIKSLPSCTESEPFTAKAK
jgi:hypothetical protein